MIGIALCDDDRYLLGELEELLYCVGEKHGIRIDVDCFDDGIKLLEKIKRGELFDIIYLDIQMEKMNGLETADKIRDLDWNVQLAYMTSYEFYMKDAFRASPIAFMVKPISIKEFEDTFLYILGKLTWHYTYYRFRYMKKEYKVPLCDILYFESNLRKIWIIWKNGSLCEYNKLNEIEKKLNQGKEDFLRIHKSYLVNYRHVAMIAYDKVIMNNGTELPLSKKYRERVDETLKVQMEKLQE